jgi:protein disulfide-isomerase A1
MHSQCAHILQYGVFPAGSAEEAAFLSVAASMRNDYVFAHVTDAALMPSSGAGEMTGPHVVMLKTYDTPLVATSDLLSADGLRAWVEAHAQPRVARLGSNDSKHISALRRMVAAKVPRVFVFGEFDDAGAADAQLLAATAAAAAAHPELNFIAADAAQNKDTVSFFALSLADLPAAVVHDTSSGDKKYTQPHITPDSLDVFISAFQAGTLAPIVKSEPIPVANSAPVTVLVADTFEAAVGLNAAVGKTFLVYFYATWCEPCQTLAPVYEEVGEHFAGRDDVVIAKMDTDAKSLSV